MTFPPAPSLYNQTRLGDDDFVANFIVRHEVLHTLERRLRAIAAHDSGLHHVLIGSRGMGKTSLLRRLAIAINRDGELAARYIPLSFREEQYNVLTLGDFWRNCGEALAEWAEATEQNDVAARLDAVLPTMAWAGDDAPAEEFAAEIARLGRRAVLLVDNIDLILDALPDDQRWTLRRRLQAPSGPIIIGAATQPLKQAADREAAFYEFFQPHYLEALSERETEQCMRSLALQRGEAGHHVLRVLDQQPERLRTLHNLTGGNPRILALIYRLLESEESQAAMADLEILLDQVTPYYKARVEEYQTPQQRAVIDAIALNWDPITTGTLSQATNIVSTTLSPLILKLRKDGLIESVETSGSYAGHQLVERFLNIWYLMRHGTRRTKQKMRWLVSFLSTFYSFDDLERILALSDTSAWSREYGHAFSEAKRKCADNLRYSANMLSDGRLELPLNNQKEQVISFSDQLIAAMEADDHERALLLSNEFLDKYSDASEAGLLKLVSIVLCAKSEALSALGRWEEALVPLDELISRFDGEALLDDQVALALSSKAQIFQKMGKIAEEISQYNQIIEAFENSGTSRLKKQVATALYSKGGAQARSNNIDDAIATFGDLDRRFGADADETLFSPVVRGLIYKGAILSRRGDYGAAIALYNEAISRYVKYGDKIYSDLQLAFLNKAMSHTRLMELDAAIAASDEVINRFNQSDDLALQRGVVRAALIKAANLGLQGDASSEISLFDYVVQTFGNVDDYEISEAVVTALYCKGAKLFERGEIGASVSAMESALKRCESWSMESGGPYGKVMVHFANILFDTGRDLERAKGLYIAAMKMEPLLASANLAWLYLLTDQTANAKGVISNIDDMPAFGMLLLEAGVAIAEDNFGRAVQLLEKVFDEEPDQGDMEFADDQSRLLRLAMHRGYGERLLAWFESTTFAERYAPLYVAYRAFVRGERTLLDANVEVRKPAQLIYDRLDAPRRAQNLQAPGPAKKKRT